MRAFLIDYSYILCSVAYIVPVLVLGRFTLPREQFRLIHYAGLANAPAGLFLYFLEGNYWTPGRIGGLRLGIEDFLISYAVGAMAWYLVALVWRRRLRLQLHWPAVLRRYLMAAIGCDLTYLVLVWDGVDPMTGLFLTCGPVAVALWWLRRENWPLALTGMIPFPLVWLLVVALTVSLFPEYLFKWNLAGQWGRPVLGVPAGEIVWAFVFGVFWPLFVGVIFDVEIVRQPIASNA
jgi:hypothetical protein